tara:strand:+ start:511 stop:1197 length:687 start_codon:yes stop_codon:yes gene_type:complete
MPKSEQEAKQTLETIVKNHTNIDIEQRIENNCKFDSVSTNSISGVGSTGLTVSGVYQSTDLKGYCETNNYLATLANLEFTSELKNDLKAALEQEGLLINQDQKTNQNIKNQLITEINNNTLQETLNDCTADLILTNEINMDNSTNANITDIVQSHDASFDCIFKNESSSTTQVKVDNKVENQMEADLKQEGLTLFASAGSSVMLIIVGAMMLVLVLMMTGKSGSQQRY